MYASGSIFYRNRPSISRKIFDAQRIVEAISTACMSPHAKCGGFWRKHLRRALRGNQIIEKSPEKFLGDRGPALALLAG